MRTEEEWFEAIAGDVAGDFQLALPSEERTLVWLVFADWLEEQGNEAGSRAARYCAATGKRPTYYTPDPVPYNGEIPGWDWYKPTLETSVKYSDTVPTAIFKILPIDPEDREANKDLSIYRTYPTPAKAFRALFIAVQAAFEQDLLTAADATAAVEESTHGS